MVADPAVVPVAEAATTVGAAVMTTAADRAAVLAAMIEAAMAVAAALAAAAAVPIWMTKSRSKGAPVLCVS